jgi:hypothetical protein
MPEVIDMPRFKTSSTTPTSWLDASRTTNPQLRMSAMPKSSRPSAMPPCRGPPPNGRSGLPSTTPAHGYSWALIGSLLGTSGEAARQRYGTKQEA